MAKETEFVRFQLIQMPCCGQLLCWVNPRLPNYCPECGKLVWIHQHRECVIATDPEAMLVHEHFEAQDLPVKTDVLLLDDADTDYLSEVLSNRIQSIADGYRGSQPSDDDESSLLYLEKLLCKIQGDKALFTKIEEKGLKALEE